MRILKEPLLHFLLIGVVLFVAYDGLNGDTGEIDSREIRVTRDDLLTFIQYRAKAFDKERFNQVLDTMPGHKLQGLIDAYVREEALYREAKALNLDRNDYVARRRLIQQLGFITRGFITTGTKLTEQELHTYFQAHQDNYYQPAEITFTHVFFNHDRHGAGQAKTLAQQTLQQLNAKLVPFHEGLGYGDRFLYDVNYVDKQADEVASHFGEPMQQQVFQLAPDDQLWQGPFSSPYGEHLVMVTRLQPGYAPELAEVQGKVYQDALRDRQEAELDEAVRGIVKGYRVTLAGGLQARAAPEQAEGKPQEPAISARPKKEDSLVGR